MSGLTKKIGAIAGMSAFIASGAIAAEIVVVSWGGAYKKSQVEAYHKPWIAKTNHSIISEDYGGGISEIKTQVDSKNVTWDVVDLELSDAIRACDEGLLEEIDLSTLPPAPDGTPAVNDFLPHMLHDCAVATAIASSIYAYDSSKIHSQNRPKTAADFFDTKKFPGKRGMHKTPTDVLEFALIADGVPIDQVYNILSTEAGIERAFAKLDTIKDDVIWWETGAQPAQLLADGEVIITTAWNGRLFNAITAENRPFEIVWDGQVYSAALWVIPKGSKNVETALDFIRFSTATEQLANQASWIPYSPARASSLPLIGNYHDNPNIQMIDHMPTSPKNFANALQSDFEFWADNQDDLNERFNAWLAQ